MMKQIKKSQCIIASVLLVIMLLACSSASTNAVSNDGYRIEQTKEQPSESVSLKEQSEAAKDKHVNTVQQNSALTSFITGLGVDPVVMYESSVLTYNILNTDVTSQYGRYMYFPDKKYLALFRNGLMGKEYTYFDDVARDKIRKGYEHYLADFAAHTLTSKNRNSYSAYGEFKGKQSWGILTGRETFAEPKVSIGYVFVKGSPYFTLTQWPAKEIPLDSSKDSEEYEATSKETLLFNKALAADMVGQMDEEALASYVVETKTQSVKPITGDVY